MTFSLLPTLLRYWDISHILLMLLPADMSLITNTDLKTDIIPVSPHNLPMSSRAEIKPGPGLDPVAPLKTGYYLGKKEISTPV